MIMKVPLRATYVNIASSGDLLGGEGLNNSAQQGTSVHTVVPESSATPASTSADGVNMVDSSQISGQ